MIEPWVLGMVNGILYNAMYHSTGLELGDELVGRYALALQVEPVTDRPIPAQVAGLRAAALHDEPLTTAFTPYPGQQPYGEAEFRAFLIRVADELESQYPWPQARTRRPEARGSGPATPGSRLRRLLRPLLPRR
ncbi:hypothetical protein [Streptomyces sp. NPDC051183]|uniref:hypothetical protein n=1 Tax=unclassified Streptomyces TaxID=2593676 RepID=UPI003427C48E